MPQVVVCREIVKRNVTRLDGLWILLAPRHLAPCEQEILVVSGQFLERPLRDIIKTQFRLATRSGTRRSLHDILLCASRRTNHLAKCLAERVALEVEVSAAEKLRGVIHEASQPEGKCFTKAT